jgi:hypothetical protein
MVRSFDTPLAVRDTLGTCEAVNDDGAHVEIAALILPDGKISKSVSSPI